MPLSGPSLVALTIIAAIAVTACDRRPLLRDEYLGKGLLQPHKTPQSQRRDGMGNPILENKEDAKPDKPK